MVVKGKSARVEAKVEDDLDNSLHGDVGLSVGQCPSMVRGQNSGVQSS